MKRIKSLYIIMILASIFLTGCADKLKCEIKTNNYNSTVVVKFEKNKPISYNFEDDMAFTVDAPEAEIYYHSKFEDFGVLISEKYASIRNRYDGVSMKIKYDFTKDHSEQEGSLLVQRNDTKKEAKKNLKSLGYKCK